MKKFFQEFKAFISKGNVFDLAVGMIIATSFNKIVSSLVNDLIMPVITWATGAASLADLSVVLRRDAEGVATLTWKYGNFFQTVIDFLIIAMSVFIMVKVVNASRDTFKELTEMVTTQTKKEYKLERKAVKAQAKAENRKFKDVWAEHEAEKKRVAEEAAKQLAEEKAKKEAEEKALHPTQEQLLIQIRDLLQENAKLKNKKDAK